MPTVHAGVMERTLTASEVRPVEAPLPPEQPLAVSASAVALPHPEKVGAGHPKAVNRKHEGWGGEDAYFCVAAEWVTYSLCAYNLYGSVRNFSRVCTTAHPALGPL